MSNDKNQKLQEIRTCQAAWSMENSLLQAYRGLFLALEAILFAAALAVLQIYGKVWWFWPILAAGIVSAFLWIVVCERRGDIASMWNREVRERSKDILLVVSEDTKRKVKDKQLHSPYDYEFATREGWSRWQVWRRVRTRIVFNKIIPALLLLTWIWMVFLWAAAN